ncbi:MAG TPA: hypothetical protein VLB44_16820 [Kofleriaceae bacterium]|nr:hypothetical protein [Kofleriaceae bacterium]
MAQRIETSIITSLSELREIEKQRIADEQAAVERARTAEIEAKRAAEQAERDADEARKRAEREEIIKIQLAQAEYERQARLRVQAAEATERARLQAELDAQRMQAELELRREEVARKRPTWMIAVTGVAFVASVALGAFAIERSRETDRAEQAARVAELQKEQAKRDAEEAQRGLDKLKQDSAELDARISNAEKQLLEQQSEADRKKLLAQLAADKKAKQEADHQAWLIEQKRLINERRRGFDSSTCLHGTLDCIDSKHK